jgi:hypothetical protein
MVDVSSEQRPGDADSRGPFTAGKDRLRKAAVFDLDGTLADISLLPVMHPGDPRLKDFESRPDSHRLVPAHDWVVELAVERSREWLVMHGVPFDDLIMRADTDNRSELEFKRTALAAIQRQYEVVLAVDDNPTVIALWSGHGVSTRLVAGWRDRPML